MKKKILVVVYNLERAREHEWLIEFMDPARYEIHFALIRKRGSYLHRFLESKGIRVHAFDYNGKSDFPFLTAKLTRLIRAEKFDIVHTHLFESSLAGMLAAWLAGVRHRVVTRHHSDYHLEYHPGAVKYDRLINRLATKIIAVSGNVERILINREHADPRKVITIPHGIMVDDYLPEATDASTRKAIRQKYGIDEGVMVIGVVSRFISWKGLQYILPAMKTVFREYPGAVLVLANAQGPYADEVTRLLSDFDSSRYRLIPFEENIPALYKLFNCFVHVPVSETAEAFGQTYIEALASGIPSVFTRSGIAMDFAENEVNCLVVPHRSSDAVARAVLTLLDSRSQALRERLISNGRELVRNKYRVELKYQRLAGLYDSMN